MKLCNQAILATLLTAIAAPNSAGAGTWDAAAEFGGTNPRGVWSYGYDPAATAGYQFKPFNAFQPLGAGLPAWIDSGYFTINTPSITRNDTAAAIVGIQPGQLSLHPGPVANGDAAILRFTAPFAGLFDIDARFFAGDVGETTAIVIKNGDLAAPIASLGNTSVNPVLSLLDVALAAGDRIDFVVGNAGNFFNDSTPTTVRISGDATESVGVPEPDILWTFAASFGVLLTLLYRRRSECI